jgi:hypothetical protein
MKILNQHIIECPEHGLFASPDYWPCPFCFHKEHIKRGPMCWTTTFITWKGEERSLTLDYIPTDDEEYNKYAFVFRRTTKPEHDKDTVWIKPHDHPAAEPAH